MEDKSNCPNYKGCQIVSIQNFVSDNIKKDIYLKTYCTGNYLQCKRFQTKKALSFCPGFVMPDSTWSIDEIMERCENEM